MSTAKMAIKLYPGVPGQAEQLHLEGLKPSISMPTRDTLASDKKVKKALNIKAYIVLYQTNLKLHVFVTTMVFTG